MKPAFSPVESVQQGLFGCLFAHQFVEFLSVFENVLELSILESRFQLHSMWQTTVDSEHVLLEFRLA